MKRVVLAGCGHAHLEIVRNAAEFSRRGVELVLVDPGRFWYSGLGSGLLGGRFTDAEDTIDPECLAKACGAGFRRDFVTGIDRGTRHLLLRSGERLVYDLASFNIGSIAANPFPADPGRVSAIKPISRIPELRRRLQEDGRIRRVVVAGGGATGCELAGNLLHLAASLGRELAVDLVESGPELLEQAPKGLRGRVFDDLSSRGATIRLGTRIVRLEGGEAVLEDGGRLGFDVLLAATGLAPSPVVEHLGLPFRKTGLEVLPTLRSVADPRIFAAGDCAAIEGHDLPKIGVYGVRAAPVLLANLLASIDGRALEPYRPQERYLSILDLADGKGFAMRGSLWFEGRPALMLKSFLDRRFLKRYRRLYGA